MLLWPNGRSTLVPLDWADPIDKAVRNALAATAERNENDPRPLWREVSRLILEPLQPHLGGIGQLFISPDSELHRVPFSALPSAQDPHRLLSEVVQLRILTTGRDLVRLRERKPARAGEAPVVMANPLYAVPGRTRRPCTTDAQASSEPSPQAGAVQWGRQKRSSALGTGKVWCPLPETEKEALEVAPLIGAGAPLMRERATALRALQQKAPRIFHIATHGFFFPVPQSEARGESGRQAVAASEDPLLRSGLVLAGADEPELNPADDGYLTAAEATGMDLEGTELVTLSACESGLGDVDDGGGEGVFGLQRALTVAGARSTLLSLWKVDDTATTAFMAEFYGRLRQGQERTEALLATQAAFRRHPEPLYRDMYFWGAFQLTGGWGAIQSLNSGPAMSEP
jgi:CHAT domain-containing protein